MVDKENKTFDEKLSVIFNNSILKARDVYLRDVPKLNDEF